MSISLFRRRSLQKIRRAMALPLLAALLSASPLSQAQPAAREPEQIRIGFQKSAVNLVVLKQRSTLEQRFKNSKIVWLEFPAGPQLLEALSAGSLDFGLTGDGPPVFAQAANKDLLYVGAEPPKPESSALLVQPASDIRTLADLKGKRIALQKGSSAQFLLVRAVKKAGLAWTDIQPVYLAPADARAAFERGSVDAWAIWDPYYGAAELSFKPRVLSTGSGLSNNNSFYLAARGFAENYPGTVLNLLDELTKADRYVQQNRKEVAQLIADVSGLNLATVHLFLSRRPNPSPTAVLSPALVADQQRVADSFKELGLIPRAVKVADIVWHPKSAPLAQQ
ncbi:ABC transporter, substrate-binding, aliphatic sulfonates family protein [Collimonas fungivorans]|uniref:Putative aliphatic sulfonates-binding protein n=1 Tax=Collimonas fungivorans TaxID=158899 RepID=A0A127PF14_9BURK|nr:sulfonate ABC transporter substrate-binding protein [Collimonas fungivorans]AMO96398.1 ABC transporter, substrate-binding, aliphatic sulfonates family protein [Collimonas fungivorans]